MEKLSSGYRINRAGDDAAGLAISEKMRAQIRGLTTAAKNAQDGISLVQTAEGALQEVHGMLNRMVELATQSANGTFDDEVDRKNLESELSALKGEIDRVAKSANFNGIKLLNGDLGDAAAAGKRREVTVNGVTDASSVIETAASKGTFKTNAALSALPADTKTNKLSIKFNDESGAENRIDIEVVATAAGTAITNGMTTVTLNGKKLDVDFNGDMSTATNFGEKVANLLNGIVGFKENFTVANDNGKLVFTNNVEGQTRAEVTEVLEGSEATATVHNLALKSVKLDVAKGKNVATTVDTAKGMKAVNVTDITNAANDPTKLQAVIDKATVIVDGEKFTAVKKGDFENDAVLRLLKEHGVDTSNVIIDDDENSDADSVGRMAARINEVFGKDTVKADGQKLIFETKSAKNSSIGLTLQVGESSESFQKLTVSVNDMSSRGLAISAISVKDQESAAKSISKIRDAINTVSSTRGDLGALQNRLEHTIANLNTTAENITASESRIRDVDMAKEMVELTKFNILQQAAQAMLAQANQAPQGVLQLLR